MSRSQALAAYRRLWRATGIAFKGDLLALNASRQQIRLGFDADRGSVSDFDEKIKYAEDVAVLLRTNVVQAGLKDKDENRYVVNLHKDVELGDNDTVKHGKRKRNTLTGEVRS